MEQRSEEWFNIRKGRVTASNVGAILGVSPHRTREQVMQQMIDEYHGRAAQFQGNVATDYGTFNEANAIADYEFVTGNTVKPCGFFSYDDWLGASPDGIVSNKIEGFESGVIEIKCPYSLRYGKAPEFKRINPTTEQGSDLPHYYAQVQIQMLCAKYDYCDFFQWSPDGYQMERVNIDSDWLNNNLPILKEFYAEYLERRDEEIDEIKASRLTAEYKDLQDILERTESRKKELLAEIVAFNKGRPGKVADMNLSLVEKEGAVSYSKIVKEKLPDLDLTPYRGKPTNYWMLK